MFKVAQYFPLYFWLLYRHFEMQCRCILIFLKFVRELERKKIQLKRVEPFWNGKRHLAKHLAVPLTFFAQREIFFQTVRISNLISVSDFPACNRSIAFCGTIWRAKTFFNSKEITQFTRTQTFRSCSEKPFYPFFIENRNKNFKIIDIFKLA